MSKYSLNFTPTPGYLLLEPLEGDQPEGYTVEGVDEMPQLAKVLAVGDSTYYPNTDIEYISPCKVGQKIIHSSAGYETVKIEGEEYRVVHFSKVLLVKS